ncbi:MAG: hypothetical protein Satyrvirus10_9 [Satyrvirus sp.]|uniref:Uncharacterized protein n=1 Tax=Satyrvirus sp. TaxID=2487771 RepID=A0A3G5ADW5_9VIRU|nr:MAG: hypothetical protein Satyrvirus10_9 [Satyrvirus sp.]
MSDISDADKYFFEANNLLLQTQNPVSSFFLLPAQLNELCRRVIELTNKATNIYLKNKLTNSAINSYRLRANAENKLELYDEYAETMVKIGDMLNNNFSVNSYYEAYNKAKKYQNINKIFKLCSKIIKCYQKNNNQQEIINFSTYILEKHLFHSDQSNFIKELLADAYFQKQLYVESKNIMEELVAVYIKYPLKLRLCNNLIFKILLSYLAVGQLTQTIKKFYYYSELVPTFIFSDKTKFITPIIGSIFKKDELKYCQIVETYNKNSDEYFVLLLLRYIYWI